MPCDTVQRSKVAFLEKSTDAKILKQALESLGFRVWESENTLTFTKAGRTGTYYKYSGEMQLPTTVDVDSIKRAYSKEVVNEQAREFGWEVEWRVNEEGNEEASVTRRSI